MTDQLLRARGEAIAEMSSAMLKAAGEALIRHGDDPHSGVLMLAAVTMVIDGIDKNVEPGFRVKMVRMLCK